MGCTFRGKLRDGICGIVLLFVAGCRGTDMRYVVPEGPTPANTVLLAQMMQELSATPGFTDALLAQLEKNGKQGPALMTPRLIDRLRQMILGKDWQGLDRFPGWTMDAINPTVKVAGRVVAKRSAVSAPGGPIPVEGEQPKHDANTSLRAEERGEAAPADVNGSGDAASSTRELKQYLDTGAYALEKAETVRLDKPSELPGFTIEGIVSDLGAGVVRGDGPNPRLAPMHAESQRIADVMNRLSMNAMGGAMEASAVLDGRRATTPEQMVEALVASGHTVVVWDARYFANFGHFHYKGQEVMMPFWVNSQIAVPGTRQVFGPARPLLVPVSHAEYEWEIRGPKVNADVSYYFGIDGKAEFRTMDTLDQTWVLGRHAHEYRGPDAVEVTRLVGKMLVAYAHQHMARPELPFGGYYPLGVCQDGVAAIEKKMTGKATLFPNTADSALFNDPRDAEINALIAEIPKDRNGGAHEVERIFGSLPTDNFDAITIPGLAQDLGAVHAAWQDGSLYRTPSWFAKMTRRIIGVAALVLLAGMVVWRRRRVNLR
jgi:hypothetical protein